MVNKVILVALATVSLGIWGALAQTPSVPTPEQQALSGKLLDEINIELQLRAEVINLHSEIQKLKDELSKRPPTSSDGNPH